MSLPDVVQQKLDQGVPVSHIERMYGLKLDPKVFKPKERAPLVLVHSQPAPEPEPADPGPDEIASVAALIPDLSDAGLRRVAAMALGLIHDRHGLAEMNKLIGVTQMAVASSGRPDEILMAVTARVAIKHGVTVADIRGDSKAYRIAHARQEAYWATRQLKTRGGAPKFTLPALGRFFHRDHSTVKIGITTHEKRVAKGNA